MNDWIIPFHVSLHASIALCTPHRSLDMCRFPSHDVCNYTPGPHKCCHQARCKYLGPWANCTQILPVGSNSQYVDWTWHMLINTWGKSITTYHTTDYITFIHHTSYFNPSACVKTPLPSMRPLENIPLKCKVVTLREPFVLKETRLKVY